MDGRRTAMAAEEAARLWKENPSWTYKEAIEKARELIGYEEEKVIEKAN